MNIAVVVSGGLTETILTSPLLATLRAGMVDLRVTLFCPERAAAVAAGLPGVDELVPLAGLAGRAGPAAGARLWWGLRRRRFDAVALCSAELAVALAAYLSGISRRVSPSRGAARMLASAAVRPLHPENLARTWLRMAGLLGIRDELHAPSFEPGAEARQRGDSLLNASALADGRLLIAIAPGAGFADDAAAALTSWDPERFAHLANQMAARHGAGIALIGSPADRAAVDRVRLDLGADAIDLTSASDPSTIAAVLARCDLLIGGDTPLLHLAAAVGTPTVGLFGPTDGVRWGPYGPDHRIVQALAPAGAAQPATMDQIRVEDVLASIESAF